MFSNFYHRRNIYLFSGFFYDLEISESLENATPNATIRLQNLPLKKYAFIFNICPDFYKSQQPVQKSSEEVEKVCNGGSQG